MDSARPNLTFSLTPGRDRALAYALLAAWTVVCIAKLWNLWPPDLAAVYIAGHLWQSGQPGLIYTAPPGFFGGPPGEWMPIITALGGTTAAETAFPYVYPPLWAVLVAPLTTVLGLPGFSNLVAIAQVPMLASCALLSARLYRPQGSALSLWVLAALSILLFSLQALTALGHNQPSITMIFLILLSMERLSAGHDRTAGALLALAAAIKLIPAVFAVIFLVERRFRALVAFLAAGGLLALASVALAGWPLHRAFLDSLAQVKGSALLSMVNTSLFPALVSGASALGFAAPFDITEKVVVFRDVPAWLGPVLAGLAVLYALALLRRLAGADPALTRGTLLLALSILLPLFGPLGWAHYYLLPLLLIPGLLLRMPGRAALPLAGALGLFSLSDLTDRIVNLPWATAVYTWVGSALWLAVLVAIFACSGRFASEGRT